ELERIEGDLPVERVGQELRPHRKAELRDLVVIVGADRNQHQQRRRKEGREGQREGQRELPLGRAEQRGKAAAPAPARNADCRACHFATSLLKRSIQPARKGLIFVQSWRTNPAISSRLLT